MKIELEALGLTKEDLQEKVIESIANRLLDERYYDDNERESGIGATMFRRKLEKIIQERLDRRIEELAKKQIFPKLTDFVDSLILQETTKWGEKVGKPLSFIEYLTKRAENYMTEPVDYDGKTKGERQGYSWSGTQTRLTHLVHQHLHYSIETAMKEALKIANNSVAQGIQETVRIKLKELSDKLTVAVSNGR